MNLKLANCLASACLLFLGLGSARADFMIDPNPAGDKLNIDQANKNVSAFSGHVGSHEVDMTSVHNVDTGGGYANINPAKDNTLLSVTFIPTDPHLFGNFSLRGQLNDPGYVNIDVWDQFLNHQSFSFLVSSRNADFARIGIIAIDGSGETIDHVTVSSINSDEQPNGFKEMKQMNFSLANSEHVPTPEPTSLLLLGSGLAALAFVGKRKNAVKE